MVEVAITVVVIRAVAVVGRGDVVVIIIVEGRSGRAAAWESRDRSGDMRIIRGFEIRVIFASVVLGIRRRMARRWQSVIVQRRTVDTRQRPIMIHLPRRRRLLLLLLLLVRYRSQRPVMIQNRLRGRGRHGLLLLLLLYRLLV